MNGEKCEGLGAELLGLLAVFLLFFGGHHALGQEKAHWQIGVNGIAGLPRGEFRDALRDPRWGGSAYFTRRIGNSPLRLGAELGLHANGNVDVDLAGIGRDDKRTADGLLTSNIYFARFLVRVQPVYGRWAPYLEGVFGAQGFDTSVVLKDCSFNCTVSTVSTDTTMSFGGGGGLSVRLTGDQTRESGFSLQIGARYLFGGETEYFLPQDLPDLARDLSPLPERSRTNMMTISFGVLFDF